MANSYLNKTFSGSPTNAKKGTVSMWFKLAQNDNSSNNYYRLFVTGADGNNRTDLNIVKPNADIDSNDTAGRLLFTHLVSSTNYTWRTNQKFVDMFSFYHLVVAYDTTQASASDRVKFYVNGEQITSFHASATIPQNTDLFYGNNSSAHHIGNSPHYSPRFFQGYMAHFAYVDGTALAPTVFGTTNSTTGQWQFKSPSGVTWGNNGVHLKFENSGNMGLDSSGNTHNFTVNGNLKQALENPSNVHATMNGLVPSSNVVFSQGNNTLTGSVSDNYSANNIASLGVSSGKWYWEAKYTTANANSNPTVGIATIENHRADVNNTSTSGYAVVRFDGEVQVNGSNASSSFWGSNPVEGDIIMFALDMDNGKFYLGKNGSWQNSGVPTSGSTGTGSITSSLSGTQAPCIRYLAAKFDLNFGNRFFGTTAISSAGSNGNGSLFEYDVPNGYYALNTKNINTYG